MRVVLCPFAASRWWNVTVPRGCLSDGDIFDSLTGAAAAQLLPSHDTMYVRVRLRAFWLWCVLSLTEAGLWEMPRSAQPDAHWIWHCRASCVTGMWQGRAGPKWLLRLHYPAKTPDMPPPIYHFPFMVTDPLTIHKWSADCTLPFAQYSLITYRWKLACTKIIHPLCCKSKREVGQGAECQEPASNSGDCSAGSSRCWYLHCHSTLWCFDTGGL